MRWFIIIICLFAFLLVGCASNPDKASLEMYKLQLAALQQEQKPACEIEFKESENVSGIKKITCYANSGRSTIPPPPRSAPHPGWRVLDTAVRVAGQILGISVISNGLVDLADVIGKNAGHNVTYGDYAGGFTSSKTTTTTTTETTIRESYNPVTESYNPVTESYNPSTDNSVTNPAPGVAQ